MRSGSVNKRLNTFFVSVGVLCFSLCVVMGTASGWFVLKYENALSCLDRFESLCTTIRRYTAEAASYYEMQDVAYYEVAGELLDTAEENLRILNADTENKYLMREYMDLLELNDSFRINLSIQKQYMEDYIYTGKDGYQLLSNNARRLDEIGAAFLERVNDMRSVLFSDIKEINRKMHRQILFCLAGIAVLLLVLFLDIRYQNKKVSEYVLAPLQQLTDTAERILSYGMEELEPESLDTFAKADQEIMSLSMVFHNLIKSTKQQFDTLKENARIRQELDKSRFKELQMQINPHFLFNTLNMIGEKAYLEGADETVELLENTANMFRYSLDFSGKEVTLARELEQLGNYVFVQEHRVGDRIQFLFELEESMHFIYIPALTLQPLIENAIVHGIAAKKSDGVIKITTRSENGGSFVGITVEDNGEGMTQVVLEKVRHDMKEYQGDSKRIGLGNVYMRLNSYYNGRASMEIDSVSQKGTVIYLRLPADR